VADLMAEKLKQTYPDLQVVGTFCPPFRAMTAEEDEQVVQMINDARPDFVWVGLGLLKQEAWIAAHLGRVKVPWMVGVGRHLITTRAPCLGRLRQCVLWVWNGCFG